MNQKKDINFNKSLHLDEHTPIFVEIRLIWWLKLYTDILLVFFAWILHKFHYVHQLLVNYCLTYLENGNSALGLFNYHSVLLEKVWRQTAWLLGELHSLSYVQRLESLKSSTVGFRRTMEDLIQLFIIDFAMDDIYYKTFFKLFTCTFTWGDT